MSEDMITTSTHIAMPKSESVERYTWLYLLNMSDEVCRHFEKEGSGAKKFVAVAVERNGVTKEFSFAEFFRLLGFDEPA